MSSRGPRTLEPARARDTFRSAVTSKAYGCLEEGPDVEPDVPPGHFISFVETRIRVKSTDDIC